MFPIRLSSLLIPILAQALCTTVPANPATTQPTNLLNSLIFDLGHPDPRIRDNATRRLWLAGDAATDLLRQAMRADDPEIAVRASRILADLQYGIRPDMPPRIVDLMRAYRASDPAKKREALDALISLGERGFAALARLSANEKDSAFRDQIFRSLAGKSLAPSAFIAEGDFTTAEMLLRAGLFTNTNESARNYAAFHLLRGSAAREIERLRPSLEAARPLQQDTRALCFLFRAVGDRDGAKTAAERSADTSLLDEILLEQRDCPTLIRRFQNRPQNHHHLPLLAAFHRLAGDRAACEATLDALVRKNAVNEENWYTVEALLLNGRPQQAIELLSRQMKYIPAFKLLVARQQYDEALVLAEKALISGMADADQFRAELAKTLHALGRTAEASKFFEQMSAGFLEDGNIAGKAHLIETLRESGNTDRAFAYAARALSPPPPADQVQPILLALFPDRDDASFWRQLVRAAHPNDSELQTLHRLRNLLEARLTATELDQLFHRAVADSPAFDADGSARAFDALVRVAADTQQHALASRHLEKQFADSQSVPAAVALAQLAVLQKQWPRAAELCAIASRRDPLRADVRYLAGRSLLEIGKTDEGSRLIATATLLPLADDARRLQLASRLQSLNLHDASLEQSRLLSLTGDFESLETGNALRALAADADSKGDFDLAASLWERSTLDCLRAATAFVEPAAYLGYSNLVHRTRAQAHLKANRFDEALREASTALTYLPGDITTAILLVPALEKLRRVDDANRLFTQVWEHQAKLLSGFPDSAELHNSAAWLLARTCRHLDKALVHAQRANTLKPDNPAILDTLSEAHFQLGQKDPALVAIRRCIELQPHIPRHRLQLKRIESSTPDTDPPPE